MLFRSRAALVAGPAATAVLNAANEVAVEAFLSHRLRFHQIAQLVGNTIEGMDKDGALRSPGSIEAVLALDEAARDKARRTLALIARD